MRQREKNVEDNRRKWGEDTRGRKIDGGLETTPLRMNGGGTENVWEDGSKRREGGDERGENQIRGRAWQEGGKYRTGKKHTHTHM